VLRWLSNRDAVGVRALVRRRCAVWFPRFHALAERVSKLILPIFLTPLIVFWMLFYLPTPARAVVPVCAVVAVLAARTARPGSSRDTARIERAGHIQAAGWPEGAGRGESASRVAGRGDRAGWVASAG
jgi:hypothetical protein